MRVMSNLLFYEEDIKTSDNVFPKSYRATELYLDTKFSSQNTSKQVNAKRYTKKALDVYYITL